MIAQIDKALQERLNGYKKSKSKIQVKDIQEYWLEQNASIKMQNKFKLNKLRLMLKKLISNSSKCQQ